MGKIEKLIGIRVKDLRDSLRLSQTDLAKNAKTSTTINRLEKGHQLPQSETLDNIISALGVDMSDIVPTEKNAKSGKSDLLTRLYSLAPTLDEEELTSVLDFINDRKELSSKEKKNSKQAP